MQFNLALDVYPSFTMGVWGMDLILCSARDVSQGQSATSALAAAFSGGQLDQTAFRAAANRAFHLRTTLF